MRDKIIEALESIDESVLCGGAYEIIADAILAKLAEGAEPDKWEGGEGWGPLVFALCAEEYGADLPRGIYPNAVLIYPHQLRSLLQAVADASYERAAKEARSTCGLDGTTIIRNLKGTLPEMDG